MPRTECQLTWVYEECAEFLRCGRGELYNRKACLASVPIVIIQRDFMEAAC